MCNGAREMIQSVKCLPDKHEDLRLDSPAPTEKAGHVFMSVMPELESQKNHGDHWPASLAKLASFKFS